MKKVYITLFMLATVFTLFAQERPVRERAHMRANPARLEIQLTSEQQEAIKKLKFEAQKEIVKLNAKAAEKKAELRLLQLEDNPSLKKINSKIDEISEINNKKMKLMAEKKMNIRKLLTEEQRACFDMHSKRMHRKGTKEFTRVMHEGRRDGMLDGMRDGVKRNREKRD